MEPQHGTRWWVRQQNSILGFYNSIFKWSSGHPCGGTSLADSFYKESKLHNSWAVQQQEIKAERDTYDKVGIMGYEMYPEVRKNKTAHDPLLPSHKVGSSWYRGTWEKQSNQHCWTCENAGLVFLWESPCKIPRISLQRSLQNNHLVINIYKYMALNSESPVAPSICGSLVT